LDKSIAIFVSDELQLLSEHQSIPADKTHSG